MSTGTDVWTDVHHERQSLLELLEALTPAQWDAPSLCAEWRVRDVVGHMVSETRMTVAQAAWGFMTSGFRINRYIAKDARQRGAAPVAMLLEDFRGVVLARTHLPGLSSLSMLEDIVIHQMDIRRPLERTSSRSRSANDPRRPGSLDEPLLSRRGTVPGHQRHRDRRGLVGRRRSGCHRAHRGVGSHPGRSLRRARPAAR